MIVTTDNTEHTEIKFSEFCTLCGKFFVVSGFGQSKSEVQIMHPYQSLNLKGSFVLLSPKQRDYGLAFNELFWRRLKNSVLMELWLEFFKKLKSS